MDKKMIYNLQYRIKRIAMKEDHLSETGKIKFLNLIHDICDDFDYKSYPF